MFERAEVRPVWMLQLLLWLPEKWETQDVGWSEALVEEKRSASFDQKKHKLSLLSVD